MGLLDIFSSGASGAVEGAVKGVGSILDNLFTSDEERLQAAERMKLIEMKPQEAQWQTNQIEAAHRSVFVAGWRPAIGWVCAASLASYYIPQYVLGAVLWVSECWKAGHLTAFPLEIKGITELVMGMLGLAGMRTFEKTKGISK